MVHAQEFSIEGRIIDFAKENITFINVTLQSKDALFLKGVTANKEGHFVFSQIKDGEYILKISYLGYEDYIQKIRLDKNVVLNPIQLKVSSEVLSEVELAIKKPIIEQKKDRLIFNIKNTILSNKNAWEILKNTPSVFVTGDNVFVRNATVDVYINNKKIQLTSRELKTFLENIAGNTIKSIEIIANPSAKYDAQGNAIINIVIKETALAYKGSVYSDYTQGKYSKYTLGMSHFYKNKKIDIFGNYSLRPYKKVVSLDESIHFMDNNLRSSYLSDIEIITESNTHNLLFNIDYVLHDKSTLSLSTLNFIKVKEDTNNKTNGIINNENNITTNTFLANNFSDKDNKNLSYALDYALKLKKEGEKITTGISFNYFDEDNKQDVNTSYFLPNNILITNNRFLVDTNQKVKIYTAQIDYTLPIAKKVNFETGAKISIINSESKFQQFDFISGNYVLNVLKSDTFLYDEVNYAAYINYNKSFEKWSFQFGLRTEYTDVKGNSITLNEINKDNYLKVFPTAYLNYELSKNNSFAISYGKRINRPKYAQLNPFQSFFSDFSANVGNPNLKPAISHNLDFTYIFKQKYRFNVFYNLEKDKPEELSFQDNQAKQIQFIVTNIDKKINTGFSFFTNYSITKRWTASINAIMYYKQVDFKTYLNTLVSNNLWRKILRINTNVALLKDKSLNLSGNFGYASPSLIGSYVQGNRNFVGLDFQKKMFKNKATLTLSISDIFNTDDVDLRSKYLNQDNGYFQKDETRTIKLGFIYNFGNKRLKENKKEKKIKEKERLNAS